MFDVIRPSNVSYRHGNIHQHKVEWGGFAPGAGAGAGTIAAITVLSILMPIRHCLFESAHLRICPCVCRSLFQAVLILIQCFLSVLGFAISEIAFLHKHHQKLPIDLVVIHKQQVRCPSAGFHRVLGMDITRFRCRLTITGLM